MTEPIEYDPEGWRGPENWDQLVAVAMSAFPDHMSDRAKRTWATRVLQKTQPLIAAKEMELCYADVISRVRIAHQLRVEVARELPTTVIGGKEYVLREDMLSKVMLDEG